MTANIAEKNDEVTIDLADLARFLWQHKKLLFAAALVGSVLLGALSLSMRNVYQTQILLSPVQSDANGLPQGGGGLSGLASLAGIRVGRGDQSIVEGLAIMASREFILRFVRDLKLKPILFSDKWDANKNQWRKPGGLAKIIKSAMPNSSAKKDAPLRNHYDSPYEPSDEVTFRYFSNKILSIDEDKKSGLITVSVNAFKPEDAELWATELVRRINDTLRTTKKAEAEKSIEYLQKVSSETGLVEMQKVVFQLIEAQTKTVMLANAKEEFAFKTIDPAFYPEKKMSPKRGLMVVGGAFGGISLTLVYLLICYGRLLQRANTSYQS